MPFFPQIFHDFLVDICLKELRWFLQCVFSEFYFEFVVFLHHYFIGKFHFTGKTFNFSLSEGENKSNYRIIFFLLHFSRVPRNIKKKQKKWKIVEIRLVCQNKKTKTEEKEKEMTTHKDNFLFLRSGIIEKNLEHRANQWSRHQQLTKNINIQYWIKIPLGLPFYICPLRHCLLLLFLYNIQQVDDSFIF